jgi:hypothetical protein
MKRILLTLSINLVFGVVQTQVSAQSFGIKEAESEVISKEGSQILYSANPNHRELAVKSFELAVNAGFSDTNGITFQEIRDRLEAGSYSEDYEVIPGTIGEHFPEPWNQGPDFNFFGYYPFSKIPYGSYRDISSGWYRGLNHGYDPIQNFKWPGARSTTIDWANYSGNSYIWDNAVQLYLSGEKAEAYQCLGHILHLLADLSVPSHIKIVNHGMDVVELNSGTPTNPDKLELIIDEYEMAISGGILVPGIVYIPDLLPEFQSALNLADTSNIPEFSNWQDYLRVLGEYTYNQPLVNQFYIAPDEDGEWGAALDENGIVRNPVTYVTLPLTEINGDWFELKIKSTATSLGTILPESKMLEMCNDLVPKAVEYGAGLIKHFYQIVTDVESEHPPAENFLLLQNYPNPFNPSTKISWQSSKGSWQTLKVFDVLGNEIVILVDEYKPVGNYEIEWDATGLPSGVYFYQLKTEGFVETKKMVLVK